MVLLAEPGTSSVGACFWPLKAETLWLIRFGPAGILSSQAHRKAVSVCSGSGPGHVRET
eukprot:CAMPEP_0180069568 /NCGR_PEP_ID=MMETSP0985-20121206/11076_1 /TAXON_ID=483367 /ORGANISM="non described non described, Strain CCMP 2436" /LENGTH=58 /DNA_ID=CAMNT_0022000529 /DNA_START=103 /DNA_END=276 /DNA_ORIENTATION=-